MQSCVELCGSENRFLDSVRAAVTAAECEVYIITADRSWVFPLMITLIAALNRGVRISVAYLPPTDADASSNRINLLRNIGCSVAVHEVGRSVIFSGVIADPLSDKPAEVVRTPELAHLAIVARTRFGAAHSDTIVTRFEMSRHMFVRDADYFVPQLLVVSLDELLRVLRRKSRFYAGCDASLEDVVVQRTNPQQVHVKAYKAHQVAILDEMFRRQKLELYGAVVATLRNGHYTPIFPPVVELHDRHGAVIIEGHTRFFRALEQERERVRALVFRGVAVEPPSSPRSWLTVRLSHDDPSDLVNHDKSLARCLERDGRDAAEWI